MCNFGIFIPRTVSVYTQSQVRSLQDLFSAYLKFRTYRVTVLTTLEVYLLSTTGMTMATNKSSRFMVGSNATVQLVR